MLTTTLNKIKAHLSGANNLESLLSRLGKIIKDSNEPLALETILEGSGFDDAVQCLNAVDGHDTQKRLFACRCAESLLYLFIHQHGTQYHANYTEPTNYTELKRAIESRIKALKKPTAKNVVAANEASRVAGVIAFKSCAAAWDHFVASARGYTFHDSTTFSWADIATAVAAAVNAEAQSPWYAVVEVAFRANWAVSGRAEINKQFRLLINLEGEDRDI